MRPSIHWVTALAVAASVCVPSAQAQEYCVACAQPDAVYRCVIGDARLAGGQPLQAFCVSTLAREGGHKGCRIKPGTVFDCDGPIKRLATDKAAPATAVPEKKTVPPTVGEMAKETMSASREGADKAAGGARRAWGCVLSLFTSC